jgi:hypothetical protein
VPDACEELRVYGILPEFEPVKKGMPIELTKPNLAVPGVAQPGDPAYIKIRSLIYRISGIYHSE